MPLLPDLITIGQLSKRSGVAPSALRFYEQIGLIASVRTSGNQRRYTRATLRRVAFVLVARQLGVSLEQTRGALATLPSDHTPRLADWERLSASWRRGLDERIAELEGLRDKLTGCIGCGCLSLRKCRLLNCEDAVARRGAGPRLLYPKGIRGRAE